MKVYRTFNFRLHLHAFILLVTFFFGEFLYSQQIKDTTFTLYYQSAVYKPDTFQVNKLLNFMSSIDGVKDIIGYADTVGKISYNKNLSQLRALNVFQIISPLINPKPSYSCKGEEFPQINRLELNRKVEICAYKFIDKPVPDLAVYVELIDSFDIPNINFMPDRAILTAESIGSIPHLVQKVKSYRDAHFEIIGHVNYQSKRDSSFLQDIYKLSKERANAIYEILIENGISKSLLKFKGVGNSRPLIIDPKNDEERMKNMRVQILAFASVKKS